MKKAAKRSKARPIFRWLAGLTCLVYLLPMIFGETMSIFDSLFVWVPFIIFGAIAVTGYLPGGRDAQDKVQLTAAAQEYAAGQMTLEEYGSVTKDIISSG